MGKLEWLIGAGVVGSLLHVANKEKKEREEAAQEERRRKSCICRFNDGMTQREFVELVHREGKAISRLKTVSIEGPVVSGKVRTVSGLSHWSFEIDFNDYGHLTGRYWLDTDNDESTIPEVLAGRIASAIKAGHCESWFYDFADNDEDDNEDDYIEYDDDLDEQESMNFCPFCGKRIHVLGARFCTVCGKKLN